MLLSLSLFPFSFDNLVGNVTRLKIDLPLLLCQGGFYSFYIEASCTSPLYFLLLINYLIEVKILSRF